MFCSCFLFQYNGIFSGVPAAIPERVFTWREIGQVEHRVRGLEAELRLASEAARRERRAVMGLLTREMAAAAKQLKWERQAVKAELKREREVAAPRSRRFHLLINKTRNLFEKTNPDSAAMSYEMMTRQ